MADWTNIPNGNIETDKPVRAIDGRALRDNPIAIAEGAPNAPRVQRIANEVPWVAAGLLSSTNYTAFTGLDRVASIRVAAMLAAGSTNTNFQIGFSTDNGATWDSPQNLSSVGGGQGLVLDAHINLVTGVVAATGVIPFDGGTASSAPTLATSLTVPTGANAVRFRSVAARSGRMYIEVTGGIA